jgi:hypothetical protein
MGESVYSIRINFESILIHDTGDGSSAGDVYFLAEVGGQRRGRSPITSLRPNSTLDLKGAGYSWEIRVLGSASVPLKVECWDHDALSADDALGSLATSVAPPWKPTTEKRTAAGGNFELTYSVDVTTIALTRTSVALVSRAATGTTYKSTLKAPNVALTVLTEITGLYKPGYDDRASPAPGTTRGSGQLKGYISEDDRGRVFRNRTPDGAWKRDTQYVELTAVVEPPSVRLPADAKMVWSFEDPDDPSNEGPDVHDDAGRILDPNDYNLVGKASANAGDNDPGGNKKAIAAFSEADPKYGFSHDETVVDIATRTTKVRFNVSDIAGDNFKVKAQLKAHPTIDLVVPGETGIMTVWDRIDLEYVKMASAAELPVDQISAHYDIACAQVDVSLKREVTGPGKDRPAMGPDWDSAFRACEDYATKGLGQFTKEGEGGWFFIVAANRMVPSVTSRILWEGNAQAFGPLVRLPSGVTLSERPAVVRVFNPAKVTGLAAPKPNDRDLHIKFSVATVMGRNLGLEPHDFHRPDDPDFAFFEADLASYGFANGATIPVQVMSSGDQSLVTAGISPGGAKVHFKSFFGGRLLVFTRSMDSAEYIRVLCHELCHAFDNAHKCGNWDWKKQTARTSCCMNYWFQFLLDDATPRAPIVWTQNRVGADLCGPHVRRMRDYHLQDNPGLKWP